MNKKNNINETIGITIYSPDVYYSNLENKIEKFIIDNTDLTPIYKDPFSHTSESIKRFYKHVASSDIKTWELVSKLFMFRESVLTVWFGSDAINKLLNIKGNSHPKFAKPNTIRRNFWCDNKICNLVHTSDNLEKMLEELFIINKENILNSLVSMNFEKKKINKLNSEIPLIKHNGILTFSKYIKKLSKKKYNIILKEPNFPCNGDAIYMFFSLKKYLDYVISFNINFISDLIHSFFNGDIELIKILEEEFQINEWDKFIISCSINTINIWNDI